MSFHIACPHCSRVLSVTEKAYGKTLPCPACHRPMTVPNRPEPPRAVATAGGQAPPPFSLTASVPPAPPRPARVPHVGAPDAQTARGSPGRLPHGMPPAPSGDAQSRTGDDSPASPCSGPAPVPRSPPRFRAGPSPLPAHMPPVPGIGGFALPEVQAAKWPGAPLQAANKTGRTLLAVGGAVGAALLLYLLVAQAVPLIRSSQRAVAARPASQSPPASSVGEAVDRVLQESRLTATGVNLPKDLVGVVVAISIAIGIIECLFGYRIFMAIVAMIGLVIGAFLAGSIGYAQSHDAVLAVVLAIVGGLLGAILMVVLQFVGVFAVGAVFGAILGAVLCAAAHSNPEPAVLVIFAAIGGIAALIWRKFLIIMATGFGGAWSVVTGIAYFTASALDRGNVQEALSPNGTYLVPVVFSWLVLGTVGVMFQYAAIPLSEPAPTLSQPPPPPLSVQS